MSPLWSLRSSMKPPRLCLTSPAPKNKKDFNCLCIWYMIKYVCVFTYCLCECGHNCVNSVHGEGQRATADVSLWSLLSWDRVSYPFLSMPGYLASDCLGYLSYIYVVIKPIIKVNLRKRMLIFWLIVLDRYESIMVGGIANKWQAWWQGGKLSAHIFKYKQKTESELEAVQGF